VSGDSRWRFGDEVDGLDRHFLRLVVGDVELNRGVQIEVMLPSFIPPSRPMAADEHDDHAKESLLGKSQ
jgi:hypothetical protein